VCSCIDKEGIPGWWTNGFMSPTPQSAWDVTQKTKKRGKQNTVCFSAESYKKKRYWVYRTRFFEKRSYVRLLLIDGGAVKKYLATVRRRTSPTTWNHIFQLQRQSRGAYCRGHENCCRLATLLIVRAPKSRSQGVGLSD